MADALQTQETGGGEGTAPVPAPEQVKPASSAQPDQPAPVEERKVSEASPAKAVEEVKNEAAKPAEASVPAPSSTAAANAEPTPATSASPASTPAPVPVTPADVPAKTDQNANDVPNGATAQSDWQQKDLELMKKIEKLEKVKDENSEDGLKLELKAREEEIDLLKARVRNLETELHAALSKPNGKNHEMIENIKQQHEELLSKARGMIFDKTKMVKHQELQIEALTTQVQSLKDINLITKDLLEIRNSEIKAMEDRLQAMEARFKVEKEKYSLVLQRAQTSTNINGDLKKEYETQLAIFKELRSKYEQRVNALVAENEKLKASISSGAEPPAQ